MHELPRFEEPTFTRVGDGRYAVNGTAYTIELGSSRWHIALADKPVIFGYRTLELAKLAFSKPLAVQAA